MSLLPEDGKGSIAEGQGLSFVMFAFLHSDGVRLDSRENC